MSKFSIIIPAHNAEEHGIRAFESIKMQNFKDYECIVVCDSCTDRTEEVAKSYGFKVAPVQHGNDGLSRSTGLDLATGEWILFMDDDDWWLHEFVLEILDKRVGAFEEDILCFSFIWKGMKYADPLGNNGMLWPAVWNKCWRREFIGNTRFPNVYSVSDWEFHKKMMKKAPKIALWDMPLYYYNYLRPGSISWLSGRNVPGEEK